jgi:hypothetical protein
MAVKRESGYMRRGDDQVAQATQQKQNVATVRKLRRKLQDVPDGEWARDGWRGYGRYAEFLRMSIGDVTLGR